MPRRHPKEDDTNQGPSPERLRERKERREERRRRRSPGFGEARGLLTPEERLTLKQSRRDAILEGDEAGIACIDRELELDREGLKRRVKS